MSERYIEDPNIADLVVNELYEEMSGIGANSESPLASVAMHYQENAYVGTEWDTWVNDYKELDIKKYFGLTIDEFLGRGRFEATELLRKAREFIVKDSKKSQQLDSDISEELGL